MAPWSDWAVEASRLQDRIRTGPVGAVWTSDRPTQVIPQFDPRAAGWRRPSRCFKIKPFNVTCMKNCKLPDGLASQQEQEDFKRMKNFGVMICSFQSSMWENGTHTILITHHCEVLSLYVKHENCPKLQFKHFLCPLSVSQSFFLVLWRYSVIVKKLKLQKHKTKRAELTVSDLWFHTESGLVFL